MSGRNRAFRSALGEVLDSEPDIDVVAVKRSAQNLADACRDADPDVVVVMAGAGEESSVRDVADHFPRSHIVCVGRPATIDALPAGRLSALIDPDRSIGVLLRMLRSLVAVPVDVDVEVDVEDATRNKSGDGGPRGALTDREVQVLRLISEGMTGEQIATALGVSPKTVDNHRRRIYAKLGVHTQTHAVTRALRDGVLAAGRRRPATSR